MQLNQDPSFQKLNKNSQKNILEIFNNSLIDYISIYGVASLSNKTKLLPINRQFENKEATSFLIDGELKGIIKCYYSLNSSLNRSLIEESLNILLGHILTYLEENNILCTLSSPKRKDYNSPLPMDCNFTFKYTLETDQEILPIQFNCYLNKKVLK